MADIRRATVDDLTTLVELRLALFAELPGEAQQPADPEFEAATRAYLATGLASGEFIAWVAVADGEIVATSGLVFFRRPPSRHNHAGLDAYVMNMYTRPAWRGQGLATTLLRHIITFVHASEARYIWLHASAAGQPIYAREGFASDPATLAMEW